MYENLAYEEIKNLPEDKRIEAWSELHKLMPSNVELARKLNTLPIAVSNAVKKYVLGEPVGRGSKKNRPEQMNSYVEPQSQERSELQQDQPQVVKPKRRYNKRKKPEVVIELPKVDIPASNVDIDSFSITITKTISGEDAQLLLNGIGGTFLKDQRYSVEIKIIER